MFQRRTFHLRTVVTFTWAALIGFLFSQFLRSLSMTGISSTVLGLADLSHVQQYWFWLKKKNIIQIPGDPSGYVGTDRTIMSESRYLSEETAILCIVMLDRDQEKWKDKSYITDDYAPTMSTAEMAISQTWGKRCEKLLFFTDRWMASDIAVIKLRDVDSVDSWSAMHQMLMYVAKNYLDNYKWFTIMQEDTFLIVENLAYYVSVLNHSLPLYIGHTFSSWGLDYNAAGPGIILSHSAVRKVSQRLSIGHCTPSSEDADTALSRCLSGLGITPWDSRDDQGRSRFLMYQPELHLVPGNLYSFDGFWRNSKYPVSEGPDCCSDFAISFHYVPPNVMFVFDYYAYHLKGYGLTSDSDSYNHDEGAKKYSRVFQKDIGPVTT